MGTILLGAVAFVVLIVVVVGVHEFGHFATAKLSGIRVDEFAIGFGPKLASRRRGETVYSVRALPLGGFVKMPGMSALEEDDGGPRGFLHARLWRQLVVLVAGVTMNFVLAGLLFGVIRTESLSSQVLANSPFAAAGIQSGDQVTAIDGRSVDTASPTSVVDALRSATDGGRGAPLTVTVASAQGGASRILHVRPDLVVVNEDDSQAVRRADGAASPEFVVDIVAGQPVTPGDAAQMLGAGAAVTVSGHAFGAAPNDPAAHVTATLRGVQDGRGGLGLVQASWRVGYGPASPGEAWPRAIVNGFTSIPTVVGANVRAIWDVVTTPNSGGIKNFQGPVGIAHDATNAAQSGWYSYLYFVGLISLSLGIINILPIPPFDGGRAVLVVRQAIMGARSGARVEMALITVGALLIGTLAILITFNDVKGF